MRQGAPIFGFNAQRAALVERTVERTVRNCADPLHTLNEAAYHETRRLEGTSRPKDVALLESWRTLARRLSKMSEPDRQAKLREITKRYAWDIVGNFDPRVFRLTTRLMPSLFTALLAPRELPRLVTDPARLFSLEALGKKIVVEGPLDTLRALARKGTLIFVPTHSSNMDSVVFGYALERAGLPPATYGAGKNLFTNPILSFFMRNLGAYRVDRRLRHQLYKDVLKTYSCVLLENGYHSLFFPGGTRSRSGAVEHKLKLGLLGTGVEAFTRSLLARRQRRVFYVPATINYLITLEAETLIADFLAEAGKAQFIIEDDESTRLSRMFSFIRKLLGMNDSVVVRFSEPLDPFGCAADADGNSRDKRQRPVDPCSHLCDLSGSVCMDEQRNRQYTRELGDEIVTAYRRDTIAMSTHLVAAACFELLREHSSSTDLFTVLRLRDFTPSRDALAQAILSVKDRVIALEKAGKIALAEPARGCSGGDILALALKAFEGYHSAPVIEPRPRGIALRDPHLLLYYQNRLAAHGIGYDPSGKARDSRRGS